MAAEAEFRAFDLTTVEARTRMRLESMAVTSSQLYVGTEAGGLYCFEFRDTAEGTEIAFSDSNPKFSSKPVKTLEAVEEWGVLLVLTDSYVRVHDLPDLTLRTKLPSTRGASLMEVTVDRHMLAVTVKRKIIVYRWDGSNFLEYSDVSLPDPARALAWAGDAVCVGTRSDYLLRAVDGGGLAKDIFPTGKGGSPAVLPLPAEELLLQLNAQGIFVGFDGNPTRQSSQLLQWPAAPLLLRYCHPFVVAVLPEKVLVHNAQTHSLIQEIMLPGVALASRCESGCIYIATPSSIHCLSMVPLRTQVDMLVATEEFKEALSLSTIARDIVGYVPEEIQDIHRLYADFLFRDGTYGEAMRHFELAHVNPRHVLALFSDLLYGPYELPGVEAVLAADGPEAKRALLELIPYLHGLRSLITDGRPLGFDMDLSELIDTALLKAYLVADSGSVLPFLRANNNCCVAECETVLTRAHKWTELVRLYEGKRLHGKALKLLARLAQGESPVSEEERPLFLREMVDYLQKLGAPCEELVLQSSKWLLAEHPKRGLQVFLSTPEGVEPCDAARVLHCIKENSRADAVASSAIAFLEHVVLERGTAASHFHDELLYMYLELLTPMLREHAPRREPHSAIRSDVEPVKSLRAKLLHFLEASERYHPEKMLSKFPRNDLHEEKAVLLSRLGRHDEALSIYVHKLKDIRLAEEYCSKFYSADSEEASDVYLSLLRAFLTTSSGASLAEADEVAADALHPAIALLQRHFARIKPEQALELLPAATPLYALKDYVEAELRHHSDLHRESQVVKSLYKSEHLQVELELNKARSRMLRITPDRTCPKCDRAIGYSAFACYPNGIVVHYSCCTDKSVCPVTGERFGTGDDDSGAV